MNKTGKRFIFTSFITALMVLPASQAALAEEVFGRWCQPANEHNENQARSVEFVWTDSEEYHARFTTEDGSESIEVLSSLPGNIYVQEGNVYGHRYRIHRRSGELQLMDNTGVLVTATILEDGQPLDSCF